MSERTVNLELRLPRETVEHIQRIAKRAQVKPETVIRIVLAAEMVRSEMLVERNKP